MDNTDLIIILSIVGGVLFVGSLMLIIKTIKKTLEKEKKKRKDFALKNNFEYNENLESKISTNFQFLKWANKRSFKNYFKKDNFIMFEYIFNTGKTQVEYTILQFKFDKNIPSFTLSKQNIFHNIAKVFGYQDIDFSNAPKFSKEYLLRGKDESKIKSFFTAEKLKFFEELKEFNNIEINKNIFMTYRYKIKLENYNEFIENNRKIIEILQR